MLTLAAGVVRRSSTPTTYFSSPVVAAADRTCQLVQVETPQTI